MAFTANDVKQLREMTGAGMLDCKKALTDTDGNMDKAVEFLREKGLAAAQKKSGRIAAEGLVAVHINEDNTAAAIVEVNSETDFVAKNEDFVNFTKTVATQAVQTNANDMNAFLAETWAEDTSKTVKDALTAKIAVIGENLNIRRFEKVVKGSGALVSYIHGAGRIGVLVELASDKNSDQLVEAGRNVAMQIAAVNPKYISRDEISGDYIEKEREVLKQQALNEGKPLNIVEKMIEGRLDKGLKEICLMDQVYIKDGEMTVKKYLENVSKEVGTPVSIKKFVRFETGEGIEKKEENFAEEVAKQIKG